MSTICADRPRPPVVARGPSRAGAALREIVLLAGLFALYELGRHLVQDQRSRAFHNAHSVVQAERQLRLPSEAALQHTLVQHAPGLLHAANVFYVSAHFPVTVAFLVWLWVRRPAAYAWARSLLVTLTAAALVLHVTAPLAPPRMLTGDGFLDTMAAYGPSAYAGGSQSLTNQYAAMPSLHAGWALVVAVVVISTLHGRWRWLAALHPLVTVAVVVVTANHYWVDCLAAAALLGLALAVLPPPTGRRAGSRTLMRKTTGSVARV